MEIISRKDAMAQGLKHYFTGKSCKNGHIEKRLVPCGKCLGCSRAHTAAWAKRNAQSISDAKKRDRASSPEKFKNWMDSWRARNMDHVRAYGKEYKANNPERTKEGLLAWKALNPDRVKEHQRLANSKPKQKMSRFIRKSVTRILEGKMPDVKSLDVLGYTPDELIQHLEKQFSKGMTWDNHGVFWHVDHIIPVAKFLEDGEEDPKIVNALSNLMPLLAVANRKKNASVLTLL